MFPYNLERLDMFPYNLERLVMFPYNLERLNKHFELFPLVTDRVRVCSSPTLSYSLCSSDERVEAYPGRSYHSCALL